MGYVIAGVLVLLIVAGFIAFLVMNSMNRNDLSDAGDPGADQNPLSLLGSDDTPLGDTRQHAGTQNDRGETIGDQDAEQFGGTGQPTTRFLREIGEAEDETDSTSVEGKRSAH